MVFAIITKVGNFEFPYFYPPKQPGFKNKRLIKPIPGNYSKNFMNAINNGEYFIPSLTNKNGTVEFSEMHFSQYGEAGLFLSYN